MCKGAVAQALAGGKEESRIQGIILYTGMTALKIAIASIPQAMCVASNINL